MKKAVVTIAVGEKFQRLHNHVAPINRIWMDRWGWDSIVIDMIPDDFQAMYEGKGKSFGWICLMYKLMIPSLFRNYDVVAFLDGDCVINPNAGCLSEYVDKIPSGGFAGVQDVSYEERELFPNWNHYYYDDLRVRGYQSNPPFPKQHANAGLLLYRPNEIWERWQELLHVDVEGGLTVENRINVYEVQEGRCFFMPEHWHVLWLYERVRRGWSKGSYSNRFSRKMNGILLGMTERDKVHAVLESVSMIHFAFEHQKMMLVDPARISLKEN